MGKPLQLCFQDGGDCSCTKRTDFRKPGSEKVWCPQKNNPPVDQKFGNLEKNYSDKGSKSPKEEIVELKAKLRALKTENETLKEVMQIIQEEFGETVVK